MLVLQYWTCTDKLLIPELPVLYIGHVTLSVSSIYVASTAGCRGV